MKLNIGKLLPLFALPALVTAADECQDEQGKCLKGHVNGDPHITTFSGVKYNCQGKGEFVLAKSLNTIDPFQVNAFMVDPNDDEDKQISVTRAVAFKVDPDIPMIRIKTQDGFAGGCTLEYEVVPDGKAPYVIPGDELRDVFPLEFDHTLKNNGKVKNHEIRITSKDTSKKMGFSYKDHDIKIDVRVKESKRLRYGCVIGINVCVNEENHPDLVGLLGTPNSNTRDDWMEKDGTPIEMPTSKTGLNLKGTDYCFDNHCVDEYAKSMFDAGTWVNQCEDNNYNKDRAEQILDAALKACADANIPVHSHDVLYDAAMACKSEEDCSGCPVDFIPDAEEENDTSNCRDDVGPTLPPSGSNGDPHFKTWKNEHFEYHGQCDLVLAKDPEFAGLGLDVQIRNKLVRFWSYIQSAAIRIGDDILEVQGTADPEDRGTHFWINFQYNAEATAIGGFPLSVIKNSHHKRRFEIDLNSKFPGQKIVISTYREFVKVDFVNGSSESFGKSVGVLGDFNTGKTLARDGVTELYDYSELGNEWQVQPSEGMLFKDVRQPQFPRKCLLPEDPQGQRRRRLDESSVSVEQAEAACASLPTMLDRKDCVYDILATQDLDMVGAF